MATFAALAPALRHRAVDGYVALFAAGGFTALLLALSTPLIEEPLTLLVVLILVVLCERFPSLLYRDGRISLSFAGVVFAALALGVLSTVLVALAIAVSGFLFAARSPRKLAFNSGMHVLSGFALATFAQATQLTGETSLAVIPAGAALGGVLYLLTTPAVAGVISLSAGQPFSAVFRQNFLWIAPHYAGIGLVVGGVALVYAAVGIVGLLVYLIPLALGGVAMQQVMSRTRTSVLEIERSRDALSAAHAEMTILLDAIPDVMMRLAPDLTITEVHRPEGSVLSADVAAGMHVARGIGGAAGAGVARLVRAALETGRAQSGEFQLPGAEPAGFVDARAVRMSADECLVILRDISERVRAEDDKRIAEEMRLSVTQNAPIMLFATDRTGRLSLLEGQGLGSLGIGKSPVLGLPVWDLLGNEAIIRGQLDMALEGRSGRLDITIDGQVFSAHTAPLHEHGGRIGGMVGVALDETERRRAEAAMVESQKLESLGVLAGGIAHDFNNLLVGILGNAGLALSELPERSPLRETIASIEVAGRRAADLARQMLAYSGRGKLNVTTVDLNSLVNETATLLRASISRRIRLDLDLPEGFPAIEADGTQINQVIMNLVINAADAIGDNEGTISIRSERIEVGPEGIDNTYPPATLTPGTYLSLTVTDTGSGMDELTRAKIFEPFFTTKFTGRGLGLAAVVGIVRGHRGAIRVQSEVGRGSTFQLILPATEGAVATPPTQVRSVAGWRSSGTVLVIDDDPTVALVTRRALKLFGFTVLMANDGASGVEIVRERSREIACVLLDMTMPGMSGRETLVAIHEIDETIPVIVMSGFAREEVDSHFRQQRIAGFVQKPYQIDDLIGHLRTVIEAERAA